MAMNAGAANGPQAVINVTPMIDVLLVLLIIFMVIAPARAVGLDALVPHEEQRETEATEAAVVLEIAADGGYRINSAPVENALLEQRLSEVYSRRANKLLFVKASPQLEFRAVATAIDTAHAASVERIALMPR
jgi:biopolymer transport protein ExbD